MNNLKCTILLMHDSIITTIVILQNSILSISINKSYKSDISNLRPRSICYDCSAYSDVRGKCIIDMKDAYYYKCPSRSNIISDIVYNKPSIRMSLFSGLYILSRMKVSEILYYNEENLTDK